MKTTVLLCATLYLSVLKNATIPKLRYGIYLFFNTETQSNRGTQRY